MDLFPADIKEFTVVHSSRIMIMEKVEEAGVIFGKTVWHF